MRWTASAPDIAKVQVTFFVSGKGFRKDCRLGKLNETMTFSFESKEKT